jgi:ABC-2 type transport system ATP-binding protein
MSANILENKSYKSSAARSAYAIETWELSKVYGLNRAVDCLDLRVEKGQIYTLLGPNGAGKTTTINMLTTLAPPTKGSARINGFDVVRESQYIRQSIGVTFQEMVIEKHLTGRALLWVHGRLYNLSKAEITTRITELAQLLEFTELLDRPVKTYSGGMKRRLELARGLLTNPSVLFLDEPTQGLDPGSRATLWAYIKFLKERKGLTILLTTHYLDEAEKMADRVGIMDRGKLVVEGTIGGLTGAMGADLVNLTGSGEPQGFVEKLRQQTWVASVNLSLGTRDSVTDKSLLLDLDATSGAEGTVQLQVGLKVEAGRYLQRILALAEREGFEVSNIAAKRPGLEDVFFKYTTGRS